MIYILLNDDGSIKQYPYTITDLRFANPKVSFPSFPSDEALALFNLYPVIATEQPAYNPITENLVDTAQQIDGAWIQKWVVEAATPEEIASRQENAKKSNKEQAEGLLQATDWAATVDIANPQYSNPYLMNQDAFLAYRSDVRKIAVNPPIIVDVWPTKPEEIWSN